MALVKLSALITSITGKMAGSVFQGNQGGLSLRPQPGVRNASVFKQQQNKGAMLSVQAAYSALSASDLVLWTNYAIFLNKKQKKNTLKTLSGQAVFIYQNQLRSVASNFVTGITPVIITTPTIQIDPALVTVNQLILNLGALDLVTSHTLDSTTEFIMVKMSRPLRASQQSHHIKMVLIPFTQIDEAVFDVASAYEAIYGRLPIVGEYVWCSITFGLKTTNGFSPEYSQRIIVEAP